MSILGSIKNFVSNAISGLSSDHNSNPANPYTRPDNYVAVINRIIGGNTTNSASTPSTDVVPQDSGTNSAVTQSNDSGYTDAMQFNHDEAQINRDWQEYMSNTSHQREVADLQAAGLNPVLSANGGAMSYSGSAASTSNSMDLAKLSAATTLAAAQIQANSAANVAGIYANASKYSADRSFQSAIFNGTLGNLVNAGKAAAMM